MFDYNSPFDNNEQRCSTHWSVYNSKRNLWRLTSPSSFSIRTMKRKSSIDQKFVSNLRDKSHWHLTFEQLLVSTDSMTFHRDYKRNKMKPFLLLQSRIRKEKKMIDGRSLSLVHNDHHLRSTDEKRSKTIRTNFIIVIISRESNKWKNPSLLHFTRRSMNKYGHFSSAPSSSSSIKSIKIVKSIKYDLSFYQHDNEMCRSDKVSVELNWLCHWDIDIDQTNRIDLYSHLISTSLEQNKTKPFFTERLFSSSWEKKNHSGWQNNGK